MMRLASAVLFADDADLLAVLEAVLAADHDLVTLAQALQDLHRAAATGAEPDPALADDGLAVDDERLAQLLPRLLRREELGVEQERRLRGDERLACTPTTISAVPNMPALMARVPVSFSTGLSMTTSTVLVRVA